MLSMQLNMLLNITTTEIILPILPGIFEFITQIRFYEFHKEILVFYLNSVLPSPRVNQQQKHFRLYYYHILGKTEIPFVTAVGLIVTIFKNFLLFLNKTDFSYLIVNIQPNIAS